MIHKSKRPPAHSLSDDQAKDVIRKNIAGHSYANLSDKTGYSESTIRALCEGVNRGHLLMQVEREPKQMIGGKR